MMFLSKKAAAAAGLTVVTFDGTNDYITTAEGIWTSGGPMTVCMCILADDYTGAYQLYISSSNSLWIEDGSLKSYADGPGFQTWTLPTGVARLSIMLAYDPAAGIGSDSLVISVNGTERITSTGTATGAVSEANTFFSTNATGGGNIFSGDATSYLWAVRGTAMDPATHYNSFFDSGTNDPLALAANGAVGGVTPDLFILGNAAAWNAGTDENSVSYTMNGSVVDA